MRANLGLREFRLPQPLAKARRYWRHAVLAAVPLVLLARIMASAPIAQDQAYHEFADQRRLLGVPHLLDVVSNLPFLFVGAAGMLLCLSPLRPPRCASWLAFFAGTALVFFGSGYYHWAPSDATLVWDRLPMTIAFMMYGLLTWSLTARSRRAVWDSTRARDQGARREFASPWRRVAT